MAKYKNPIQWGAPFGITGEAPIDSRMVVDREEDLYKVDTWYPENGTRTPVYAGMAVTVLDKACIYILLDKDDYTNPASWTNLCGGGGTSPGIYGCGCQGSQGGQGAPGKPGCCVCLDSYVDADTGEVLLEGGCIDDVIERLLERIIDLEDRLNNVITEIVPDENSARDISIDIVDNPSGGKTAKIKLNGISN